MTNKHNTTELRKPWEVLREAATLMQEANPASYYGDLLLRADFLEAAAAPKPPPTLAEAVRAYLDAARSGHACAKEFHAMKEALARTENGA